MERNRSHPYSGHEDFSSYPIGHQFDEGEWHVTPSGMFFRTARDKQEPGYPPDTHIVRNEAGHAALSVRLVPRATGTNGSTVEFTFPRFHGRRVHVCTIAGIRTGTPEPEPRRFEFTVSLFREDGNRPMDLMRYFDIGDTSIDVDLSSSGSLAVGSATISVASTDLIIPTIEIDGVAWEYDDWAAVDSRRTS